MFCFDRILALHGITGKKGAVDGKVTFIFFRNLRRDFSKQVRVGFLAPVQILYSSGFICVALLVLPGKMYIVTVLR